MRLLALASGLLIFILDVVIKRWIQQHPELRFDPVVVVPGYVRIDYLTNDGIAFGLLSEGTFPYQPMVLSLIGIVALLVVLYYIARLPGSGALPFAALGLLLGGIAGNLTDRLLHRHVIDYMTLHWQDSYAWPTFNLADAAITTGVALLILDSLIEHRRSRVAAAALLLVLVSPWPTLQAAQPIDGIVESLQREYRQIQTLRARFRQEVVDRGITLVESGVVIMKKPGRMYWEYQEPASKYFVADGANTYFYVPQDKQVMIREMDLTEVDSPLLFLMGRGNLKRDFVIAVAEESAGSGRIVLQLRPRIPEAEFEFLLLEIDPDSMLIYRLSVIEPLGKRSDFLLTEIERNVKIPDSQFVLRYPSDVEEVFY